MIQHIAVEPGALVYAVYDDPSQAPGWLAQLVKRVTSNLVQCPIMILPTAKGQKAAAVKGHRGLTRAEAIVAEHYRSKGYKVIRLEHMFTSQLRKLPADVIPMYFEAVDQLQEELLHALPYSVYERFIIGAECKREAPNVRKRSLAMYPPDFLVISPMREWFFVEVKGQTDFIHFNQANWFVNLLPPNWHYQIVATAPLKAARQPIFVPGGKVRAGPLWADLEREKNEALATEFALREATITANREAKLNPKWSKPPSRAAQIRMIKERIDNL